jgi:7-carboxy-7-deazaguanine synthase
MKNGSIPSSKPLPAKPGFLRVTEHYLCLEGEGRTLGAATYLIRLSGCNLRCWWCDSKFSSFREDEAKELPWKKLATAALASGAAWVSFTGGEPTWRGEKELDSLARLCRALRKGGLKVKVETNGLLLPGNLKGLVDLWSVAPKWDGARSYQNHESPAMRYDLGALSRLVRSFGPSGRLQFKFVITAEKDGSPRAADLRRTREILARLPKILGLPVFLVPEGLAPGADYLERNRRLAETVLDSLKVWKGWDLRVLPQWHRVLYGDQRKK